jgi:hypothetical protein
MCTHCIVKGFEKNMNDNTIVTALRNVVTEKQRTTITLLQKVQFKFKCLLTVKVEYIK